MSQLLMGFRGAHPLSELGAGDVKARELEAQGVAPAAERVLRGGVRGVPRERVGAHEGADVHDLRCGGAVSGLGDRNETFFQQHAYHSVY